MDAAKCVRLHPLVAIVSSMAAALKRALEHQRPGRIERLRTSRRLDPRVASPDEDTGPEAQPNGGDAECSILLGVNSRRKRAELSLRLLRPARELSGRSSREGVNDGSSRAAHLLSLSLPAADRTF
jgi:hypothetical protein